MAIITSGTIRDLTTGFKLNFNDGFRNAETNWSRVASRLPSSTGIEIYPFLGQFPRLRQWVGDRVYKSMTQYSYSLTNITYEATVEIPREAIEDDQYGVYAPLMSEAGFAGAQHAEELVFAALAAARTGLCYDGQPMISSSHPVGSSTVSNDQGGSGTAWYLLDCRRSLKPLMYQERIAPELTVLNAPNDDNVFRENSLVYGIRARGAAGYGMWQQIYGSRETLDATNFATAMEAMMSVRSDEDRPLGVMPSHLVVPPALRAEAMNLINASLLSSGGSNINYQAVEVIVSPYLT